MGKRKHYKRRSKYNLYVDKLLYDNIQKLKRLNRYNRNNKKDPYGRTDGEYQIAYALKRMKLRYVPEYVVEGLQGDTYGYRVADFYLPRENMVIEHLGRWNSSEDDKKRYRHKHFVYEKNGIDHIFVYPKCLNNISFYLRLNIRKILEERQRSTQTEYPDTPKAGFINRLKNFFTGR